MGGYLRVDYPAGPDSTSYLAHDVSGDRFPDLLASPNSFMGAVAYVLNDGQGGFGTWQQVPTCPSVYDVISLGDINNDGIKDLVVPCNDGRVATLFGKAAPPWIGTPTIKTLAGPGVFYQDLAISDLNQDGNKDLFAVQSSPSRLVKIVL